MVWALACVGVCVVRPFPGGRHSHAARRLGRDRGASGARASHEMSSSAPASSSIKWRTAFLFMFFDIERFWQFVCGNLTSWLYSKLYRLRRADGMSFLCLQKRSMLLLFLFRLGLT